MTPVSPRVLVVGSGLAGLATALFLARRGQPVDLVEQDRSPIPTGVRAAGGWLRTAVPQGAHSHTFLARSRQLLAAEAPDVLAALRAAGVRELPLRPPPTMIYEPAPVPDLVALAARRPVVEWVLRCAAEREPEVRVHAGTEVTGLVESGGVLTGVHVDGGVVDADLVVDAAGANSPVPGWLAAKGRPVPERSSPCGLTFYTRFWVLHRSADPGVLDRGHCAGGTFDGYSCSVFPADNGTFSVTFAARSDDLALGALGDEAGFDAAAARIPSIAAWTDGAVAVPISGVSVLAGPDNRLRVLAPSGVPVLPGLLAVGDAGATTDAALHRGATLGLESALACARALVEHGTDAMAATAAADAAQQAVLGPWFEDSVTQSAARWASRPTVTAADPVSHADAALAAEREPEVWAEFTALTHLLRTPDQVLSRPEIVRQVRAVLDDGWRPGPVEAPQRDELAAVARAAASWRPARVPG